LVAGTTVLFPLYRFQLYNFIAFKEHLEAAYLVVVEHVLGSDLIFFNLSQFVIEDEGKLPQIIDRIDDTC
jgi:hypothetical protein